MLRTTLRHAGKPAAAGSAAPASTARPPASAAGPAGPGPAIRDTAATARPAPAEPSEGATRTRRRGTGTTPADTRAADAVQNPSGGGFRGGTAA